MQIHPLSEPQQELHIHIHPLCMEQTTFRRTRLQLRLVRSVCLVSILIYTHLFALVLLHRQNRSWKGPAALQPGCNPWRATCQLSSLSRSIDIRDHHDENTEGTAAAAAASESESDSTLRRNLDLPHRASSGRSLRFVVGHPRTQS